jgi:hypothetical protein
MSKNKTAVMCGKEQMERGGTIWVFRASAFSK